MLIAIAQEVARYNWHTVRLTELESNYAIQTEIDNHGWPGLFITQIPLYWFGAPWIYKKHTDKLLSAAYGENIALDNSRNCDMPEK